MKNANPVSRLAAVVLLGLSLGWGACAREEAVRAPVAAAPKPISEFFPIRVGDRVVRMQLAVRMDEMQRGLMGRRDLGPEDGMIFVYERPQQLSFWMRNTPTPLDIGFFDREGRLIKVATMRAYDTDVTDSGSDRVRFALEMRAGWFSQQGMAEGAKLDLYQVVNAVRARGFNPTKLGL